MEILRDKNGKPQGTIREIAGGQERLYDRAGTRSLPTAQTRTTPMTTTGSASARATDCRDSSKMRSSRLNARSR